MTNTKRRWKYLQSRFILKFRPLLPERFAWRMQRRMEKHKPAHTSSYWKYLESRFILKFRPLLPERFAWRMQRRMEKHRPENINSRWKYLESRLILKFRPLLPERVVWRMQRRMEKHAPSAKVMPQRLSQYRSSVDLSALSPQARRIYEELKAAVEQKRGTA